MTSTATASATSSPSAPHDGCWPAGADGGTFEFTYIGDAGCGWHGYSRLAGPSDINGDVSPASSASAARTGASHDGSATGAAASPTPATSCATCRSSPTTSKASSDINRDGLADVIGTYPTYNCVQGFAGDGRGGLGGFVEWCDMLDFTSSYTPWAWATSIATASATSSPSNEAGPLARWRSDGRLRWNYGAPTAADGGDYTLA